MVTNFPAGPKESCDIADKMKAAGAEYVEAPVLGSQPEASKGALLIMVGSETQPESSRAWPVLALLGKEPMHMGAVGTAAATKLALNQLIASLTVNQPCFPECCLASCCCPQASRSHQLLRLTCLVCFAVSQKDPCNKLSLPGHA